METLVCAATRRELNAFDPAPLDSVSDGPFVCSGEIGYLVTGAGIPCALTSVLETARRERPARILNIGIAGAYPASGLRLGDIVLGASEIYGDIGLELPAEPRFQPAGELPWASFYQRRLPLASSAEFDGPPVLAGCTVNLCTGTEKTGRLRERLFGVAFETMEGAAVAHAGEWLGIPVLEVRAISNIAALRDMQPANIQRAVDRLADFFRLCREKQRA